MLVCFAEFFLMNRHCQRRQVFWVFFLNFIFYNSPILIYSYKHQDALAKGARWKEKQIMDFFFPSSSVCLRNKTSCWWHHLPGQPITFHLVGFYQTWSQFNPIMARKKRGAKKKKEYVDKSCFESQELTLIPPPLFFPQCTLLENDDFTGPAFCLQTG